MIFDRDYFRDEVLRFRDMAGQRSYTVAQLDRAFAALTFVFFRCVATQVAPATTEDDKDMMTGWFECVREEWARRATYRIMHQIEDCPC